MPQQTQIAPAAAPQAPPAPPAPVEPAVRGMVRIGDEVIPIGGGDPSIAQVGSDPAAVYRGYQEQRDVLREWLNRAENRRSEIRQQLRESASDADRAGLNTRLQEVDARIMELEKQIRVAEDQAARAAAVPGAVVPEPERNGPPDEVFVIPIVFTIFVLAPIALAYARRIWKRTGVVVSGIPDALMDRLARMEQAVDTIAVEVERVSEGQRFLTKVMSEVPRGLGVGAAQPVEVKAREGTNVPR